MLEPFSNRGLLTEEPLKGNSDLLINAMSFGSDEEARSFIQSIIDDEFTIFDRPIHIRYEDWLFEIDTNICIFCKDKMDEDFCYVFAMMKENSKREKDFNEYMKSLADKYDVSTFSGAGTKKGLSTIE